MVDFDSQFRICTFYIPIALFKCIQIIRHILITLILQDAVLILAVVIVSTVQTDKRVASVGNFSHHIDIFIVFSLWKRIFLQDIFFVKSSPDVITDFHILK